MLIVRNSIFIAYSNLEITVGPKYPTTGQTFCFGFEDSDPLELGWQQHQFYHQKRAKIYTLIEIGQNINVHIKFRS